MGECWTEQEAPRLPCVGQKALHRKTNPTPEEKADSGEMWGACGEAKEEVKLENRISEIKEAHLVTIRLA